MPEKTKPRRSLSDEAKARIGAASRARINQLKRDERGHFVGAIDGTVAPGPSPELLPIPSTTVEEIRKATDILPDHIAQVQELGRAMAESPRLREAISLNAQHARTIDQLRTERNDLREDVAKHKAEAKRATENEALLQRTLDESRKTCQERESQLKRIAVFVDGSAGLTADFPARVQHLRTLADATHELQPKLAELEAERDELKDKIAELEGLLHSREAVIAYQQKSLDDTTAERNQAREERDQMYADIEPLAAYWRERDPEAHFDNPPKIGFLTSVTLRRLERWESLARERKEALDAITGDLADARTYQERLQAERDQFMGLIDQLANYWLKRGVSFIRSSATNDLFAKNVVEHTIERLDRNWWSRLFNRGGSK